MHLYRWICTLDRFGRGWKSKSRREEFLCDLTVAPPFLFFFHRFTIVDTSRQKRSIRSSVFANFHFVCLLLVNVNSFPFRLVSRIQAPLNESSNINFYSLVYQYSLSYFLFLFHFIISSRCSVFFFCSFFCIAIDNSARIVDYVNIHKFLWYYLSFYFIYLSCLFHFFSFLFILCIVSCHANFSIFIIHTIHITFQFFFLYTVILQYLHYLLISFLFFFPIFCKEILSYIHRIIFYLYIIIYIYINLI